MHAAARNWLTLQGFHSTDGLAWREDQVFFELTKEEKAARIVALGCTHYVDDLPEILAMLPDSIQKVLFSPSEVVHRHPSWQLMTTWQDLPHILRMS